MKLLMLIFHMGEIVQGNPDTALVDSLYEQIDTLQAIVENLQSNNQMLWGALCAVVVTSFTYMRILHSKIEKSEARRAKFAERFIRIHAKPEKPETVEE